MWDFSYDPTLLDKPILQRVADQTDITLMMPRAYGYRVLSHMRFGFGT